MTTTEPVLLTGFNRPDTMRRVLERIRDYQPTELFVAVDGPRSNSDSDADLVRECYALTQSIDWDCTVHTLFHDANLGCGRAMSAAISWFFEHVERGIILEDDVLPEPSFFEFCAELLDRYQDDDRVFAVSGCNLVPLDHVAEARAPYRFSRIPTVWGWATWRRSWDSYRLDIRDWKSETSPVALARTLDGSLTMTAFWSTEFELTGRGNVDTWDWQLTYAAMRSNQLVATSNVNLIENLGFRPDATHTRADSSRLQPASAIAMPIAEVAVAWDRQADEWATRRHFGGSILTSLDRWRQYLTTPKKRNAPWL